MDEQRLLPSPGSDDMYIVYIYIYIHIHIHIVMCVQFCMAHLCMHAVLNSSMYAAYSENAH